MKLLRKKGVQILNYLKTFFNYQNPSSVLKRFNKTKDEERNKIQANSIKRIK